MERPPPGTPFPHVNDGMATIRKLAWLHFWRLYAKAAAAAVVGLLSLVVLLVALMAPRADVASSAHAAVVAEQQPRGGYVRTSLRFPSRSRLVADADGGRRIVLNGVQDELTPPNAEEYEVVVRVAGSAAAGGAARAIGAARAAGAAADADAAADAEQLPLPDELPRPLLFADGFEFVNLSHARISNTLKQLHAAGRLGSKHLSGAPGGHSSSPAATASAAAASTAASATTSSATAASASIATNTAEAPAADARDVPTLEDTLASQLQGWSPFRRASDRAVGWAAGWTAPSYAAKCAGFVMRRGGPLGGALSGSGDGFDRVARRVHIDQDLAGDPLRARGLTWLFRLPGVELLNLWIPLDEVVRLQPLALMSTATLNQLDVARLRANSTRNAGGHGGSFPSDRLAVMRPEGDGQQQFFFKP